MEDRLNCHHDFGFDAHEFELSHIPPNQPISDISSGVNFIIQTCLSIINSSMQREDYTPLLCIALMKHKENKYYLLRCSEALHEHVYSNLMAHRQSHVGFLYNSKSENIGNLHSIFINL